MTIIESGVNQRYGAVMDEIERRVGFDLANALDEIVGERLAEAQDYGARVGPSIFEPAVPVPLEDLLTLVDRVEGWRDALMRKLIEVAEADRCLADRLGAEIERELRQP